MRVDNQAAIDRLAQALTEYRARLPKSGPHFIKSKAAESRYIDSLSRSYGIGRKTLLQAIEMMKEMR